MTTRWRIGQIDFLTISSIVWLVVVFFAETLLNWLPLFHSWDIRWDTQTLVHILLLFWAHHFSGLAVCYTFHDQFEMRGEITQTFMKRTKGNRDPWRPCCPVRFCQRSWIEVCMTRCGLVECSHLFKFRYVMQIWGMYKYFQIGLVVWIL